MNSCENAVIQNLKDAGCNAEEIESFMPEYRKGDIKAALKILAEVRQKLLDSIHKRENKISCLDYLVYIIEKEHKAGGVTDDGEIEGHDALGKAYAMGTQV